MTHLERFAKIATRAQSLANQRGGNYSALTLDELCEFMVLYDDALNRAEDAGAFTPPVRGGDNV